MTTEAVVWDGDEVIKMKSPSACSVCKYPAFYVSISFHAPYCSKECLNEEWDNYWKLESEHDPCD